MGNKPNQSLMKIDSIKKENLVISDQVIITNEFNKYFHLSANQEFMPEYGCQICLTVKVYIYIYICEYG